MGRGGGIIDMTGLSGFGSVRARALAGAAVVAIASPAWGQETTRPFDIPTQDMVTALVAFGRQSGSDILFSGPDVRGLTSTAVVGRHRPEDALRRLVGGTTLVVRRVNASAFVVERTIPKRVEEIGPEVDFEDIIVTGSRLRGAPPTAPVITVGRRDIERSGYGQVGELIRSIPQNFSGGQNPGVIGGSTATGNANISNASTVNLRGLGSDATLVLLNGRRLPGDASGQAADISGIPLGAIDRVEIVTDGSSAIYGSDAIAGVANFILRRDFDGIELAGRWGVATQGGGEEQTYTALAGVSRDRWHAMANIERSRQDSIKASQRDFTSSAAPDTDLVRPQGRTSIFLAGGVDASSTVRFSADALFSEREIDRYRHQPAGTSVVIDNETSTRSYGLGATARIELAQGWAVDVTGSTARGESDHLSEYVDFGFVDHVNYENEVRYGEANLTGAFDVLPAGTLRVATGGGYRSETFALTSDTGIRPTFGERDIGYVFAEALAPLAADLPLLQSLDLSVSARWEDYSDFGATTVPKIGLRYVPVEGLSLRSTWGKSFKAPTLFSQYFERSAIVYRASTFGQAGGGTAIQFTGGNPDLRPERSTSWTVGAEYSPPTLRSLTIGATYFRIAYTDRIVTPITSMATGLIDPRFADFVTRNPTPEQQAALIAQTTRFVNVSGAPYNPSTVVAILRNNSTNAASQTVDGLDFFYRQSFALEEGSVSLSANATWSNLEQQTLPDTPVFELSGTVGSVPEVKARVGSTWDVGQLSLSVFANHVSGLSDMRVRPAQDVGSWTTFDANLAYRFDRRGDSLSGVTLALSALNLLDRAPPRTGESPTYAGIFYDSTNASPVGRFVALTFRKSF